MIVDGGAFAQPVFPHPQPGERLASNDAHVPGFLARPGIDRILHDLNNVLAATRCASSLLRRRAETGPQPILDHLDNATDRGIGLMRQLITLATDERPTDERPADEKPADAGPPTG